MLYIILRLKVEKINCCFNWLKIIDKRSNCQLFNYWLIRMHYLRIIAISCRKREEQIVILMCIIFHVPTVHIIHMAVVLCLLNCLKNPEIILRFTKAWVLNIIYWLFRYLATGACIYNSEKCGSICHLEIAQCKTGTS